jgi:hypothetical protein
MDPPGQASEEREIMSTRGGRRAAVRVMVLALLASAVAVIAEVRGGTAPHAMDAAVDADAERARTAAHLERVELELRARDVSQLSDARRAARARHLDVLRDYRLAGIFPRNHDFPATREPYFMDAHGTLCAMAYLIARSGRQDLVERVAASRNNARIAELASDAELVAWLDTAGLTPEEAGMIQPMYGWQPAPEPDPHAVSDGYAIGTAAATGLGIVSGIWNVQVRHAPTRAAGVFGIASGAAALGLGAAHIGSSGETQKYAIWNVAVGTVATTLGVRTLLAARDRRPAGTAGRLGAAGAGGTAGRLGAAGGAGAGPRGGATLQAAPTLSADGAAGFSVRVSF